MRIIINLSILLIYFSAQIIAYAQQDYERKCFRLLSEEHYKQAMLIAKGQNNQPLTKIILAQKYLNSAATEHSFVEIMQFVDENVYWPQRNLLRVQAENALNTKISHQLIIKWFTKYPPLTGKGHKYYALAAAKQLKNPTKLAAIVKTAWKLGEFNQEELSSFYKKFQYILTNTDHIRRIEYLLHQQRFTAAKACFSYVPKGYQANFAIQIALIDQKKGASKNFQKLSRKFWTPGLVYRYLHVIRNQQPELSVTLRMVRFLKNYPDYARKLWKLQSYIAREHIERQQYKQAYKIYRSAPAAGAVDKSQRAFLSGWLALRFLHKPDLAISHFIEFRRIVKTPMSKARGLYWLGRAYADNGEQTRAKSLYQIAATKYPYIFYGQVAAIEIGLQQIKLPQGMDIKQIPATYKTKLSEVAKAALIVAKYGSNQLAASYINAAFWQTKHDKLASLALAKYLQQQGNIYHLSWLGKQAMQQHVFLTEYLYPMPYNKANKAPIETALIYSIIRKESLFDQYAVSRANAYGLMQLIEPTAAATAAHLQIDFKLEQLLSDPHYNILLGSAYLYNLITQYKGSYILAAAAYNAGPHNVDKWLKIYGDPRGMSDLHQILDWLELIPFYETRDYVQRILENLQVYRYLLDKEPLKLKQDLLNQKR